MVMVAKTITITHHIRTCCSWETRGCEGGVMNRKERGEAEGWNLKREGTTRRPTEGGRARCGENGYDTWRRMSGGRDDGARHTDGTSECAAGGDLAKERGSRKWGRRHRYTTPWVRATGAVRLRTETPTKPQPHSQRWLYNTTSTPSGRAASVHGTIGR